MDRSKCRTMIKLYEDKRILWDTSHVHHINAKERQRAWVDIANSLNFPVSEVKRKMCSLLGSYRCEKSREKKSQVLGKGRNGVYISKWFAYDLFGFMSTRSNPGSTEDTTETNEQPEELSQDTTNSTNPIDKASTTKEGRMKCVDIESMRSKPDQHQPSPLRSFNVPKQTASCSNDLHCTFGQHIGNELRKYDPRTLAHVKHAINKIIFEADIGKYHDPAGGHVHPLGYEYVTANLHPETSRPRAAVEAASQTIPTEQSSGDMDSSSDSK